MDEIAGQVVDFVRTHRDWVFLIALLFAAAETTAVISVLVPSTAILVGFGALVATGHLDFQPIWAGATLGALIGSSFSYWLGWRYGDALTTAWPLSRHPDLVARGRDVFARRGAAAVGVGHFLTFLRPVVFLMAGAARMRPAVFLVWTALGCTLWAYALPKAGEIGGDLAAVIWTLFA
jgi:membrane protein DedA with SNARE-associated domain